VAGRCSSFNLPRAVVVVIGHVAGLQHVAESLTHGAPHEIDFAGASLAVSARAGVIRVGRGVRASETGDSSGGSVQSDVCSALIGFVGVLVGDAQALTPRCRSTLFRNRSVHRPTWSPRSLRRTLGGCCSC